MTSMLITFAVMVIVIVVLWYLLQQLPLPAPAQQIIQIALVGAGRNRPLAISKQATPAAHGYREFPRPASIDCSSATVNDLRYAWRMRDSDVRKAVRAMLDQRHAGDFDTRIVEEMGVWSGSVRIDIAVINGELCGFELKSDRDTLQRLPLQSELYSRVFDRLDLVVGERHAMKAEEHIPQWWGIQVAAEAGGCVSLHDHRAGAPNPNPDPYLIAQLLWKTEAVEALAVRGLAKGWRAKRIKEIHERLASEVPLSELKDVVRSALKARTDWLRQVQPGQLDMTVHTNPHPMF